MAITNSFKRRSWSWVPGLLIGLPFVLLFGAMSVSYLVDILRLSDAPSVVTTAEFAEELKAHHEFWAILPDPQWDCSTLVHTKVGNETETEVFIRDPENSIAILVTYSDPRECADLDQARVVGVGWLMSEKHIENLEEEGRLETVQGYRTMITFCLTCGKQNSILGLVVSVILEVISFGVTVLMILPWVGKGSGRQRKYDERLEEK